jgi:hypothetical protein
LQPTSFFLLFLGIDLGLDNVRTVVIFSRSSPSFFLFLLLAFFVFGVLLYSRLLCRGGLFIAFVV